MEVNLVAEGFKFMLLGMGIVFIFLLLMIVVLEFQGRILTKYFPEKEKTTSTTPKATDNTKIIAAITAAIQHHKNSKG